jgi:hypothetical protein
MTEWKAYTWYGVYCDYNCGSITAVAASLEMARCECLKELTNNHTHKWEDISDCRVIMEEEPDIEDLPCVIVCLGSA